MSANLGLKVLAGAVALAIGGTAMANTSLNGTSTGDVFVNIVDTSNNTSFLFDTGVSQSAFNGNSNYSFNFASDPNYAAFLAAEGGSDNVDYSVFSATGGGGTETVLFTSSITPPATRTSGNFATAQTTIGGTTGFLVNANTITSTTTNSVDLSGTFEFGTALQEGVLSNQLLNSGLANAAGGYADDAALGTALAFYEDAATRSGGVSINGQAFAGTWDVSGGVATYTASTSAVPLPTPVLLLLSGLGLMGVVTRRSKTV
jgi:hypothetical protein